MKDIAILLYYFAFVAQIGATILAFAAFRFVGKYRIGWIILAIGLLLMAGRRITPLISIQETGSYNFLDAILAALISLLLVIGIFVISKIVKDWQEKSRRLEKLLTFDFLTQVFSKADVLKKGEIEITSPEKGITLGSDKVKVSGKTLKNHKVQVTLNTAKPVEVISNGE